MNTGMSVSFKLNSSLVSLLKMKRLLAILSLAAFSSYSFIFCKIILFSLLANGGNMILPWVELEMEFFFGMND